jgi:hypothetical protein
MLSLIFGALVAQQGQPLPDSYIGLYADRNDRAYMVTSGSTIEYIDGEQWGVIAGIYQAPNHDYVGTWAQSKTLTTDEAKNWILNRDRFSWGDAWFKAQSKSYKDFKAPFIGIFKADNPRYTGEFRAKFLSNNTFTAKFVDSKGINYIDTSLTYLGGYDKVLIGGVYKDKYTELNLTENWNGQRWSAEGTFNHLSKKYNVQGERIYSRGRADLIDPSNGRVAGQLIYGYSPSKDAVRGFRSGNLERTDCVLVNFVVGGSPSIQVKFLSR